MKALHVLSRLLDKSKDEVIALTVLSKSIDAQAISNLVAENFR